MRTYRGHYIIMFIGNIYNNKRYKAKLQREKAYDVEFEGNKVQASEDLLTVGLCRMQQGVVTAHVKSCLPRKLIKVSVPRVFTRGLSHRHLMPGT